MSDTVFCMPAQGQGDIVELSQLKVTELKALCGEYGLKKGSRKEELIMRIHLHFRGSN